MVHDVEDGQPFRSGRKGWSSRRTFVIGRLLAAGHGADGNVVAHLDRFLDVDAPVRTLGGLPSVERAEGVDVGRQALPVGSRSAVVRGHQLVDGGDVVFVDYPPDVVADKRSELAVSHDPWSYLPGGNANARREPARTEVASRSSTRPCALDRRWCARPDQMTHLARCAVPRIRRRNSGARHLESVFVSPGGMVALETNLIPARPEVVRSRRLIAGTPLSRAALGWAICDRCQAKVDRLGD